MQSLPQATTLEAAAQFFAAHKLTTAPVMNEAGDIIGVISDFQLLRLLLRVRQEGNKLVTLDEIKGELDPVVLVNETESIVTAFQLMIESPNHRIYATHGGKLSGALSPKDLILYLAGVKGDDREALDSVLQKQLNSAVRELLNTRRQLTEFQKMFYDSPYLMHSVDRTGKIINANKMIHSVLGYEPGELVGKSLRQLYPSENYKEAMAGLETVFALGFHPVVNVTMLKKNGEAVRIDIASTLKIDEQGSPIGTITVGRFGDSHRMINYLQKAAQAYAGKKLADRKSS